MRWVSTDATSFWTATTSLCWAVTIDCKAVWQMENVIFDVSLWQFYHLAFQCSHPCLQIVVDCQQSVHLRNQLVLKTKQCDLCKSSFMTMTIMKIITIISTWVLKGWRSWWRSAATTPDRRRTSDHSCASCIVINWYQGNYYTPLTGIIIDKDLHYWLNMGNACFCFFPGKVDNFLCHTVRLSFICCNLVHPCPKISTIRCLLTFWGLSAALFMVVHTFRPYPIYCPVLPSYTATS